MEKAKKIPRSIEPLDMGTLAAPVGNTYQAIAIIGRRARQLSLHMKEELDVKLEDFSVPSDSLDEIFENAEQIEICKYYERMPTPAAVATHEFLEDKLFYRPTEQEASDLN